MGFRASTLSSAFGLLTCAIAAACGDDWTNGGKNHFDPGVVDVGDTLADGGETGDSAYEGGWDVGDCQSSIVPTVDLSGTALPLSEAGDVLHDFHLVDQFDEKVRLYDFCHKAVYLEWSALW